ncbi:conjugal transfer relaxosome component TraJ [Legionella geestiana]|uniref:Conjugal transfer relaxosome component TraJ n=1 Tax=Legionella geestiana TaxID=45065 RepID=A0A0W0U735_9GAMM|nr:conjugal transfer transcriptional regulator TraJ [Legionella geestiana]KTD03712.1 conjugal transfer relaxosome component TraJ [Legionella geestiana]QBS11521.1 conjugal transfer transcriptional regulator TraJ [Legionella geestiana]STX53814.1 traJ protein [Legionella geestiana]
MNDITPTRKHGRHLRVPVLPVEESTIKENAAKAGLSIAEYLRRCGLGHTIPSVLDKHHIHELAKINADMGRLGGLLKLWLTRETTLDANAVRTLLNRIRHTQNMMLRS